LKRHSYGSTGRVPPQFHPANLNVGQYAARANWVYGANPERTAVEIGEESRRSGVAGAAWIPPRETKKAKTALVNILHGDLSPEPSEVPL
jgi:hypothetical protein